MANPADTTAYALPDGRMAVNVTEAKTLAVTDQGYVQNVIYADGVVTLPATATAGQWTIRNGGVPVTSGPAGSGKNGNKISVSPNASDSIAGLAGSEVDDKDAINTAATARVGDEITILNNGRTAGPSVIRLKGVWAREA
jgi:uncharacterized protein YabE (DUF348 family)